MADLAAPPPADPAAPAATGRRRKVSYRHAALILAERDPVLARLVEAAGLPRFPAPTENNFATLVRSVTYQQLAGAAARAIHGRLVAALEQDITPERLLSIPPGVLPATRPSTRKVESLRDLAVKVLDGSVVLDARRLARVSDEEIVAQLSAVRGIGKWSAEIFLMFQLRRMDVWPTGDLAIRRGYGLAWGTPAPTPKVLDGLGEPYRPYRTVLAWYCWRAAQLYGASAASAVTA